MINNDHPRQIFDTIKTSEIDTERYRVFYRCMKSISPWWLVGKDYPVSKNCNIPDETHYYRTCGDWPALVNYAGTIFVRMVVGAKADHEDALSRINVFLGYRAPFEITGYSLFNGNKPPITAGKFYPIQHNEFDFIQNDRGDILPVGVMDNHIQFHFVQMELSFENGLKSQNKTEIVKPVTDEAEVADFFGVLHGFLTRLNENVKSSVIQERSIESVLQTDFTDFNHQIKRYPLYER